MTAVARARPDECDVLAGLRGRPKRLPCRLLYDARGAALFEDITRLPEYYPTRTELALLAAHLPDIADAIGVAARVIEPGSGAGIKTRRLLQALDRPASFVGIDVSREALEHAGAALRAEFPELDVHTIVADFTMQFRIPAPQRPTGRTLVFFPGSTIGNFEPADAIAFLAGLLRSAGPNASLLLGADGTRDPAVLIPAYDDARGVTAEFDRNVLVHLNRTYAATFRVDRFHHRAVWNEAESRVEMHLVSECDQVVTVAGERFELAAGESVITEYSYKHTSAAMREMLRLAGWCVDAVFTASENPMRLWLCTPRPR